MPQEFAQAQEIKVSNRTLSRSCLIALREIPAFIGPPSFFHLELEALSIGK